MENQTVKRLQLKNDGEYVSNNFGDFCNDCGIQHVESVRSMLHHAQKPLKFWAEAISTACYLWNRSPTTFLKNVTLYEHWYGKKPEISNLKVFGCKAYVYVPDAKRKSNFDRKSIPWVFVGYPANENGFKFYNPQTKKMTRLRDVIFMEGKFNVKICDCTQENFAFFTVSVGNTENDNAEWNNDAPENGNVEDPWPSTKKLKDLNK